MAFTKLNHNKLQELMDRKCIRPADLAKSLGVSRQMANYIVHHGGRNYALRLARVLGCEEADIIYNVTRRVKGYEIVNNKVRKVTPRT